MKISTFKTLTILLFAQFFLVRYPFAQFSQSSVFEIEYQNKYESFLPILLKEQGIALLHSNQYQWHFVKLDKDLHKQFEFSFELKKVITCGRYSMVGNKLFVLFIESFGSAKEVIILQFDLSTQKVVQFKPVLLNEEVLSDFIVLGSNIVFNGYFKNEPIVNIQKMGSQIAKARLVGFSPKSILHDIKPLTDSSYTVVTSDEKKQYLLIDEISVNGNRINQRKFELGKDRKIFSALVENSDKGQMIVGMWSGNNSLKPNGIFTVLIGNDRAGNENPKVYTFVELKHFLEFLPAKKVSHLIEKMKHEKEKGEDFRYELNVLPKRLAANKDGFDFFCIVYDVSWNGNKGIGTNRIMMNVANSNASFTSNDSFTGTTDLRPLVESFAVLKINFDGEISNTLQAAPESLRSVNINNISDFCILDDKFSVLFCQQNNLTVVAKDFNNQIKSRDVVTLKVLPNEEEIVSETGTSNIAHWYDHSFCVYGFRRVKEKTSEKIRYVFYINKVETN